MVNTQANRFGQSARVRRLGFWREVGTGGALFRQQGAGLDVPDQEGRLIAT